MKLLGIIIGLVFMITLIPQSAATEVWSDDFSDGNYDGWTVTVGDWLCNTTNQYLTCDFSSVIQHRIHYPSSQVVGTWSFDLYQGADQSEGLYGTYIFFMVNGTDPPYDYEGYGVRISGDTVYLVRSDGSIYYSANLGLADIGDITRIWTHFDITRNSTGGFHVYVNVPSGTPEAEPVISVINTQYTYSERFVVYNNIQFTRIDNFVVDDEILITPLVDEPTTSETPTEISTETPTNGGGTPLPIDPMLLGIGGAVAVIIIAAVVFLKRR